MQSFFSSSVRGIRALGIWAAGCVASAVLLSVDVSAQQPPPPASAAAAPLPEAVAGEQALMSQDEQQKRQAWQKSMSQRPVPKKGCFRGAYPSLEWQEVRCGEPSKFQNPPASGPRPNLVGNGNDISAQVSGPKINTAIGSFDSVTPSSVTVSGPWGGNANAANAFTLQINSQFFSTPACNGVAGCIGWQQFIYSQNQCGGPCIFMEYWLINYGATCPAGPWIQSGNSCWFNSASTPAPAISGAQLQGTTLTGTASATTDTVVLTSPGGTATATAADSVVSLSQQWNTAEFGIFGDCCSSQVNFSAGTTLVARTRVINGNTSAPACVAQGFTAETNNLSFGPSPPAASAPGPAVIFAASSAGGSPSNCAAATTIGDTHLTTFGGLLYDFQAAGDFLLAETGPDFAVQTRQVSGAPSWPNATVNKAVAVRAGKSRVAICLAPPRVVINGRQARMVEKRATLLPGGGQILVDGNVYIVRGPSGDSIRAVNNTSYIDVSVGLGRWPGNVRGLLANGTGGVRSIETRSGEMLMSPFSHDALYGRFAESWRVPANDSMLSACGGTRIERSVPRRPFFARDLPADLAKRTRAVCVQAGVRQGPLQDACTLDVAVIGNSDAAKVFAAMPDPVALGDAVGDDGKGTGGCRRDDGNADGCKEDGSKM
ncbi:MULTISPECIES: VWD domain-containing protein [Burkholderia]|uniref:VWD domain-containing protein n=1 Tax=Burkholderia TaxID=32008 RepID=UPI000AE95F87|nr:MULTISPECIES: VWD domain-containing protein [unclassified Burkholderia]